MSGQFIRKFVTCGEAGHYSKNCPMKPCTVCNSIDHVASKCPIRLANVKEAAKEAKRISNMPPENVAKQREADRVENMSPIQRDKKSIKNKDNKAAASSSSSKSAVKRKLVVVDEPSHCSAGADAAEGIRVIEENQNTTEMNVPNSAVNRDAKKYQVIVSI